MALAVDLVTGIPAREWMLLPLTLTFSPEGRVHQSRRRMEGVSAWKVPLAHL